MPKRKQKQEEPSSPSESDGDITTDGSTDEDSSGFPSAGEPSAGSDGGGSSEGYDRIDVDFEFFDPREKDFLGLKTLLNNWLDGRTYACSELVDTIIDQARSGRGAKECGMHA